MGTIYTREQWSKDGSFSAVVGQEIEEGIYDDMLNVLPPLHLPQEAKDMGYIAGFMMSEPHCAEINKATGRYMAHYAAFGKRDGKCYFLGYMNKYGEVLEEKR